MSVSLFLLAPPLMYHQGFHSWSEWLKCEDWSLLCTHDSAYWKCSDRFFDRGRAYSDWLWAIEGTSDNTSKVQTNWPLPPKWWLENPTHSNPPNYTTNSLLWHIDLQLSWQNLPFPIPVTFSQSSELLMCSNHLTSPGCTATSPKTSRAEFGYGHNGDSSTLLICLIMWKLMLSGVRPDRISTHSDISDSTVPP